MDTLLVKFYSVDIDGKETLVRALRIKDTQENVSNAAYALQEQWMEKNPGKFAYWVQTWPRPSSIV